jgi:hypothetical protein
MTTFKLIIKKIIKTENNIFSYNHDKTDTVNIVYKVLYKDFLNKDITVRKKFDFLNDSLQNFFLQDKYEKKEEFIQYFCKIQQTYNALNRFAFLYKYKKAKIVVDNDMGLNRINENQKGVLCIFHKNAKYLFTANDIINIINTSLTNNYEFFAEPLCIKNPYNNLPFAKSILYNIYLFIKFQTNLRPELLFHFFSCNFNLSIFKRKHEYILRDYSIKNYVYKSPTNIIIQEINNMIEDFNSSCIKTNLINRIVIDKEFPKDKLIKIMRPYLLIFVVSNYSLLFYEKVEAKLYLKHLLLMFNNFNPQFGRKKIKIQMGTAQNFQKKIVGKIIEFDDYHKSFTDKSTRKYLEDHLNYYEKVYYINNEVILIDNIENELIHDNDENEDDEEDYDEVDSVS